MIKLSDYVTQFLVDHGIKHVFMLTGGGCMHLVDSFGRQKGIEYICCLHEQAAAFAAQAYAEAMRPFIRQKLPGEHRGAWDLTNFEAGARLSSGSLIRSTTAVEPLPPSRPRLTRS